MRRFILDASAILRFTDREPGFERMRNLFEEAARQETDLLLSAVNWGEIVAAVLKRSGSRAQQILDNLAALPWTIVPVDAVAAAAAGQCKARYGIPYADAFAASLTLSCSTGSAADPPTLITADNDFRKLPADSIPIEFLPGK